METMKRFNLNPIHEKVSQGTWQERTDLAAVDSESEIDGLLAQTCDVDEPMSLATLPPESLDSEGEILQVGVEGGTKFKKKVSLSEVRHFFQTFNVC